MSNEKEDEIRVKIPPAYKELFEPHLFKSFYGGRGAARSWSFARALAVLGTQKKLRILCTRELQSSIRDSVHRILSDQIELCGLSKFYRIQRDGIFSHLGTEFLFKGLRFNIQEIKSTEGVDICWVEEAQSVSDESWEILIPTVFRQQNSELWLSWNTGEASDPTYQRFVTSIPDGCISKKVSYRDNPYFPPNLDKVRLYLQRVDPDAYSHVWEGNPLSISDACVFKNKFVVDAFEAPAGARFYFGADFGFSQDPSTLIRSYVEDNHLFIDYEAYGAGVEIDELPQLYDTIPGAREWKIKADRSRPDTISYIKRQGFDIMGYSYKKLNQDTATAQYGEGVFIKEGIAFLRKFEKIHIHQRCTKTLEEFKLYSYKTDPRTNEILPIIVDKHNHVIDALRYSFDKKIHGGVDWEAVVGN